MSEIFPDRSLGSLFTELSRELGTLVRKEIQLAKTEATEKARQAGSGAALVAIGGVLLLVALLALATTAILALSEVVAPWLAALIVAVVVALVGIVVLSKGLSNLRGENLTPRRTLETIRANTQWAKEQLR